MTASPARIQAFFMPAPGGQRFCLLHEPAPGQPVRGAVLCLPPLAEEMNAARRISAVFARALAAGGWTVLQVDWLGCGDSSGDFADASWDAWTDDALRALHWLRQRQDGPCWLWGLRCGALLAAHLCRLQTPPGCLLLWQPVLSGQQHLTQFLRLQMAGDLLKGQATRGTAALLQRLEAGHPVEVAGYTLSPALAQGLRQADLERLAPSTRILCLEQGPGGRATSGGPAALQPAPGAPRSPSPAPPPALAQAPGEGADVSPALQALLQRWQAAGCQARAWPVADAAFWQLGEGPDPLAWVDTSLQALTHAQEPA